MRRGALIEELLDTPTRQALGPFFREGWILFLCLVVFGSLGGTFLLGALPRGWSGVWRLGILVGMVALAAGIAGPLITRALRRS